MNTNMLNKVGGLQATDNDEPYPSLSDNHDYEPNLEFDDSELQHSENNVGDCINSNDGINADFSNVCESPIPDFTGEDNFEEQLAVSCNDNLDSFIYYTSSSSYTEVGMSTSDPFAKIALHDIVDVKGDDSLGRKIIVVYACRLPPIAHIDHSLFLSYFTYTLDKYVEQDYSLVYFHHGLTSKNKPSLRWLVQAYKAFDRKYKKNLKALYLVHPTNFLKILSQIFRPIISAKFGKKLNYIHTLSELNQYIPLDKLDIPREVIQYDNSLTGNVTPAKVLSPNVIQNDLELPTRQFGVTLSFIKHHLRTTIPPVVKQCIEYMDEPDALETEGIFRRSANATKIRELKEAANQGQTLTFNNVHDAAVLLKTFLRELKEPLLTFDLYEEIMLFQSWNKDEQLRLVSILMMEKLPVDNYQILKYIMAFLSRVMERSDLNKMNAQNLAVVFGPNLVWSEMETMSLIAIGPINMFTQYLLQHYNEIFMI